MLIKKMRSRQEQNYLNFDRQNYGKLVEAKSQNGRCGKVAHAHTHWKASTERREANVQARDTSNREIRAQVICRRLIKPK